MVTKCPNRLVAFNTGVPYGDVATRFWQRLSVDIQRNAHRALVRRVAARNGGRDDLERVMDDVVLLEEPGL